MDFFFSSVFALFMVMDPFGNIPIFIASLNKVAPERRKFIMLRELCIALCIMLVFLLLGNRFLNLLHIHSYTLTLSGGIILFLIALKMVFGQAEEAKADPKDEEPFIVPLAIPLVAGPAALSFLLIQSAQAPSRMVMFAVILTASVINSAILLLSFPISNLLGKRGITALERLTGMILILMSVNMVMNGISEFMEGIK
ncbi:multiple antibiotic resistance protein [Parelusimicrobium proximum]|uniref:MarC family protein n=1 Tax=Parelusimicrobium proximum TaxID=3228953 RepID=UPI003D1747B1